MSLSLRSTVFRSLLLAAAVAGCNSILDNTAGRLQEASTPTDVATTQPPVDASTGTSSSSDGSTTTPPAPETPPPAPVPVPPEGCSSSQRLCQSSCVALTDPTYGCGAASCEACKAPHGSPACQGSTCIVRACDKGYADCNGKPEDGCEVDLSKAASCGACNAVCPAAAPVCAPAGDSFQCGTGCTASDPLLCGSQCVSPMTNASHCGGCDQKCPVIEHGESTCQNGGCKLTCKTDYRACGGKCTVVTDPNACGPSCTVCPVPSNTTAATCAADTCGYAACSANYGNCNNNAADGCETPLLTDALNCGMCGKSCNGQTCTNGVCDAPPPPPPAENDAGP